MPAGPGQCKASLVLSMNKQMFRYTKLMEKRAAGLKQRC